MIIDSFDLDNLIVSYNMYRACFHRALDEILSVVW